MGANGKAEKFSLSKKLFGKKKKNTNNGGNGPDDVEDPNNVHVEDNKSVSYFTLFGLADKRDKTILAVGVIAALINGALMPLFSLLFGNFADAAAGGIHGFMHRISKVAWEMCVLGAISFVASSVFNTCFTYFSENQVTRLRVKYLQAVVGQDIAWFDVRTPAALPARMSEDVLKVRDAIGQKASMMCMNVSMCIVGYIIAFYRGWQITLVMIATSPLIMLCGALMAKAMAGLASKGQNEYAEAGAVAEEVLESIKTVASFGGEQRSIDRYNAKVQKALNSGVKASVYRGFSIGFTISVVYWTYALTFWYGGTLIRDQTINPSTGNPYQGGDVLTVFMSAMMATFSIAQIAPHFQAFSEGCAAGGKIFPLMKENATIEPKVKRLSEGGEAEANMTPVKFESLKLDDVKFNYPARPALQVLKGISLEIKRGQKVAFVGESGSGKSTLVQLIERFYDPAEGQVLVNGVDIKTMPVHKHRALFGYVGQEPFLFADSIRNNLRYGLTGSSIPSEEEMRKACKDAQILDFIEGLPEGFDTYAGPGGSQMSGGQKQRIAIARALLRHPEILLLDEATSALDNESEKMVQATIDHLQSTVSITTISIAHRLSTIKNSEVIFVMKLGELVEQGTNDELMEKQGVYASLVSAQAAASAKEDEQAAADTEAAATSSVDTASEMVRRKSTRTRTATAGVLGGDEEDDDEHESPNESLLKTEDEKEKERKAEIAKTYKTPWRRLLGFNKDQKWWFLPAILGSFMTGSAFPLNALLLSRALFAFYYPPFLVMEHVDNICFYYIGLGVMILIGQLIDSGCFGYLGENFTCNVRKQCFAKIMEQDMGFFDFPEHAAGKLTASLSTYAVKMNSLTGSSLGIYSQAITGLIVGVIIGFCGSWQLTLVMLAMLPILMLAAKFNMSVRMTGKKEQDNLKQSQLIASEAIQNMRTVRAFMAESWTVDRYAEFASDANDTSGSTAIIRGLLFGGSNCIIFLAYALGFWYGGHLMVYNGLGYSRMLQSLMSVMFAAMAVGQAMAFLPDVAEAKVSAHDVFEVLDTESKINAMRSDGTVTDMGDGVVEFKDVHFKYPTNPNLPILKGVSFRIEPGQQVAFVGPSGSGKSTIMALMQRFYDVESGSITIGGDDIRMLDVAWWRAQNGYVGQEPVLFDMTLAENVRYGKEDASMGELEKVANMSNMDYVTSMGGSVKWDDPMGPKGCRLSGGQKQRAAIARALVRDPHIIFLDEATSALDSTSEKVVQHAIDTASVGRTSVTVAHRLTTVRNCDVIYVITDGRIVESGNHDSLMAKHGVYYDLYTKGQKLFSMASRNDYYALVCGIVAALCNGALMPMFSLLFGNFASASAGGLDGFMDRIVTITWQMCILAGVALITGAIFNTCFTYFSENQASRLRVKYLQAVIGQDIAWFDVRTPAAIPSRMAEDVLKVRDAIGSRASMCCVNIAMSVVGYIIAFYRGWQITLVMMSSLPLIMVAGALIAKVMSSLSSKGQTQYAAAGAVAEEVLGSVKTVASFGGEKRSMAKYALVVKDALTSGIRGGIFRGLSIGFTMAVIFWTYALTFWYGGTLIRDGVTNPSTGKPYQGGDVLTVFMSAMMATFSLALIAPHVQAFAEGCAAGGKIFPLFEQKASIEPDVHRLADMPESSATTPPHLESFELEKVKFNYPARPELQVIKGVSLRINRGEKVAFVGESGSGKSTLVQLIERFYDPVEGRVLVNGVDIKTMPVHKHRALFGYVGQEPFLFADSIRNNLTYGLVGKNLPSDAAIRDVCKKAQILDFIESLPEGFDTYAGPGGSQVSGGQKQRIAIARALLRNPQILLLDEATSALDNESEKMVQATIDHLQSTVSITTISIAHRLSTVKNSDKIFVMRLGNLVEQGSHSELMAIDGVYSALVSAQAAASPDDSVTARAERSRRSSSAAEQLLTKASSQRKQSLYTIGESSNGEQDFEDRLLGKTEEDVEAERKKLIAKSYKTPWKRLLGLSKKEKWWFIPAIGGAFVTGAGFPLNALLLSHALSFFYYPPLLIMDHISKVALYYVGLGALLFFGHVVESLAFSVIGENFTCNVRKQCFNKILEQDMGFFDFPEHAAGKLTASLSTYAVKMNSITGASLGIYARALTGMIVGAAIGFTGSWQLTLVMLAIVPFLGIAAKVNMSVKVVGKKEQDELKQAQLVASEAIQNMRSVRAFMAESWTVEAYDRYAARSSNTSFSAASVRGLTFGASTCIIFLAYAVGFYYGGHLMVYDGLNYTHMMQALMGIMFSAMAVGQAMAFLPDVAEAKVAAHDVFEILDTESKINAVNLDGTVRELGNGIIEFNDVHFSYPTHPEVEILKGVSFRIEPGQQVAFVGPSGSGKSTVMALMQRFYDVSGGSVSVGGTDVRMLDVAWWRAQNGYVGQEPVLFDMTLAENVRYGKEDASMGELEKVANMSNMDYVTSMGGSVKWDDPMGPKGCRLSGGQKQRAAIARALVRDPHIIFLDEATSALDSTSEKVVQHAIDNASVGRTSVTIAHRLSTVRNCDVIYVVAGGKIVESGNHEALLAKGGVYHDLYIKGQK